MAIAVANCRDYLKNFDLDSLFIEQLGWDRCATALEITVDGKAFVLRAIAQKRGMVAFTLNGRIPDYSTRRKIERQITKSAHEHLVIFIDPDKSFQTWQWVKRETGKPIACREHIYHRNQSGDALIQKLQAIAFSIEEEESLTLTQVVSSARSAFDVERITKRFYDRFKTEHDVFFRFIKGIPDDELHHWYASVMLNRLMFIYFIQKKRFLDGDINYLHTKLVLAKDWGKDSFYHKILCPLFFEGFAKKPDQRSTATNKLLGKIPYLNGGIFQRHQIEELHGKQIQIADVAFEKLFTFFEQYQWHLDERPLRADNEVNPDVLGYIFEKYINQKQMGAYYTKEDITGYISKYTVLPFLFDAARTKCKVAFDNSKGPNIWDLLKIDPDRYIYEAVKKGVALHLPSEILTGLKDVSKRTEWNKSASEDYALPTETWREVNTRRKSYEEVRKKLVAGEIQNINDLITYNLDIRQFAQDVIENCEGPDLLRTFWYAIETITVLDPTCGSGAFLFAALNILEPLYEACLDRMESFIEDLERSGQKHHPEKFSDFRKVLERVSQHPNKRYFIFKSIIVNNLYGVDIMEEAVEICKLRLFLKLIAQIDQEEQIEPLPDIDFNIRAGNTLVGYATYDEVKRAVTSQLDFNNTLGRIEEKAQDVDQLFCLFRQQQTELGGEVVAEDKQVLQVRLKSLEDELNHYLANEYGVDTKKRGHYEQWLKTYHPFHWFIDFYRIVKNGGFNVIIGNPPYVEYSKVRNVYSVKNYITEDSSNLYAFVSERSLNLINKRGSFGFIVPISVVCTQRMKALQERIASLAHSAWFSNYAERPSRLFVGAEVLLTIIITRAAGQGEGGFFTTGFTKWSTEERPFLFERVSYCAAPQKPKPYVIPKLTKPMEISILRKMVSSRGLLSQHLLRNSNHKIFYRIGGGRYWKIFTNFQPKFVLNDKSAISSRENYLYLSSEILRDAAISVLSSSLFYWYFILTTNCRDLNPSDLNEFPINLDTISKSNLSALAQLCVKLMEDYKDNSKLKEKTSSLTGEIMYQEFYPRFSKPILDKIDKVLAQHYSFSDEELDFIINYDVKYRMGPDDEDSDAE